MKNSFTFFSLIIFSACFGQVDSADYYERVIGYVPKHFQNQTFIYDKPNGFKVDSIAEPTEGWIQFVILRQEQDWVQIKSASIAPGIELLNDLKDKWVNVSDIWFDLSNDSSNCYSEPDLNSDFISIDFQTVNLVEIKGNWAKAKFTIENIVYEGWFRKEDQCGFPWTSCTY